MSKADEIFAQNCRKHMISGREIWVRRNDAMLAIEQAQREAIEECRRAAANAYPDSMMECENCHDQPWTDALEAIRALAPHRKGQ